MEENARKSITFGKELFDFLNKGKLSDKYIRVDPPKELGVGECSNVFQVQNIDTKEYCACKKINMANMRNENKYADDHLEIRILTKTDHPNIIKLYDAYEERDFLYLITEECTGQMLYDRIIRICDKKHFSEKQAALIFQQLMSAINYCHLNKIVHRDLKPEHIIFLSNDDESKIKVLDFGLSIEMRPKQSNLKAKVGSVCYLSPEVIEGKYDEKCDIWSAGIILYSLLAGKLPFQGSTDEETIELIKKAQLNFPEKQWMNISCDAKDLINHIIVSPSSLRYSAQEVLEHTWIKDCAPTSLEFLPELDISYMVQYKNSVKLKKAALTYISSRVNDYDLKKLRTTFEELDQNKDGRITLQEMKDGFEKINKSTNTNIEELFNSIDTNHSGNIDYTEFISSLIEPSIYLNEARLREAFMKFDKDKSGKISKNELIEFFKIADHANELELEGMINLIDKDGDGEIDMNEFFAMMFENSSMSCDIIGNQPKEQIQIVNQEEQKSGYESESKMKQLQNQIQDESKISQQPKIKEQLQLENKTPTQDQTQSTENKESSNKEGDTTGFKQQKTFSFGKKDFAYRITGKVDDFYDIHRDLGKGAYGKVQLVQHKLTKEFRACKQMSKLRIKQIPYFNMEIDIMIEADHPNIIKLYEVYQDSRYFYLILEEATGGELYDRIQDNIKMNKMFSEKEAANIFSQLMSAINYCHSKGIIHRDLKLENILFATKEEDSPIKVIDFGLSKKHSGNDKKNLKSRVGTPYYISPEVLNRDYDEKCDIWSAGVILYVILTGTPPFNGPSDNEIFTKIKNQDYSFPENEWKNISLDVQDLIKHMLCPVQERYTAQQVLDHIWITNCASNSKEYLTDMNINSFEQYKKTNNLKKIVLTYMCSRLRDSDIKNLRAIFEKMDSNKDGRITFEELNAGFEKINQGNDPSLRELFHCIDTNISGSIDYTEFLASTIDQQIYMKQERLMEAFVEIDKDKNGKISKNELKHIFKTHQIEDDDIDELIKQNDINGDGEIDYSEFVIMMGTVSQQYDTLQKKTSIASLMPIENKEKTEESTSVHILQKEDVILNVIQQPLNDNQSKNKNSCEKSTQTKTPELIEQETQTDNQ